MRRPPHRLLRSLLRPHRRRCSSRWSCCWSRTRPRWPGPYLVMLGIDRGIAPLRAPATPGRWSRSRSRSRVAAVAEYLAKRGFLALSGRIGQAVLLDLRQRVYDHFQRLSVGFHERYTSGRMVSRLTSDMDSIAELVDGGIDDLVLAVLSVLSVAGILLWLDRPLAAGDAGVVPVPALAVPLVPAGLGAGVPADPGGGRAGHRPLRRVDRRHPGGAGVPPRAAQPARSSTRSTTTTARPT